jgi:SAM-dependent methyltransferase
MSRSSLYDSERLAAAYATSRPPVHRQVIASAKTRIEHLGVARARRALDIGCGAGLSTIALEPLARTLFGLEPVARMLAHHREVAPGAGFVVGRAERLPFATAAFDLLSAAGALNYANPRLVLPEVARVLTVGGLLLVYDFSGGRRLAGDSRLDDWFTSFEARYPYPPGYAMDVRALNFEAESLRLEHYEEIEAVVPMTAEAYLAYVLGETNVELAVSRGVAEETIASWCRPALAGIFGGGARDVLFDAYAAYVRKQGPRRSTPR